MINLEEISSEIGVFKALRLAIIGKDCLAKGLASFCASRGIEVTLFSDTYTMDNIDNLKFISLEENQRRNRWAHLKDVSLIIVSSCNAIILEEILFSAAAFSRIIIIGSIEGILHNTDFYSTIHLKNLELVLFSVGARHNSYHRKCDY
jgi:hypothetical protein